MTPSPNHPEHCVDFSFAYLNLETLSELCVYHFYCALHSYVYRIADKLRCF